jgi:pyruvate formate lyase activating enzyme
MTPEALDLLIGAGLDSLCLDIKGDEVFYTRFCNGVDPGPVWRNALRAKEKGLHLEVVNLVIPGANDGKETLMVIIARTRDDLGSDTPLHFTKFYPAYRAREYGLRQVTPVKTLERARELALGLGLDFVYIGNVPGHEGEDTRCPRCGEKLIDRYAYMVLSYKVTNDGCCPNCGRKIPVTGEPTSNPRHVEVR